MLVAHSPFPASIVKAQSACRGARFPIIEVAHSTQYSWLTLSLGLVWNRYADLCIAVSDDVSRAVTTRGFRRKLVILAGVDQAEMRLWVEGSLDVALGMRESLGVKSSQRLIVAVGSLVALKGHRFLLDAVAELRDSNIHAAIVGEGDERASLEQQISRLGLVGRVHLLGRQADAWQWAAVADIIAHPSLYEGLPVALMEARVLGIPTVASDVGGIAQLFDGASASRLTAPESSADLERAIREVLDDLPLFAEEFLTRASGPTRWDISRYSREFYAALASESIKFASRSQDRN
ncbi:Glycosyl transferases group 1 [Cryobacterium luteum]|nr:Glycosyl transferases group 1 [Cryobacterium luteum]